MVLKPSSTLREKPLTDHAGSGDAAFRFFLALAVLACAWTTLIQPRLPGVLAWLSQLGGAG